MKNIRKFRTHPMVWLHWSCQHLLLWKKRYFLPQLQPRIRLHWNQFINRSSTQTRRIRREIAGNPCTFLESVRLAWMPPPSAKIRKSRRLQRHLATTLVWCRMDSPSWTDRLIFRLRWNFLTILLDILYCVLFSKWVMFQTSLYYVLFYETLKVIWYHHLILVFFSIIQQITIFSTIYLFNI